ncbi:redoxin domain-containing protein [Kibdelosporangium philippinense]|uniref:Redoxin domain-containing protein n=1 Tax=Kibdelosporangium philippinense TaxID=211113 RepID=A0ABS8ZWT1_9PSEU|nr:redoxin domain-containing protein [Kibdelosporangium philippinense]MCE7012158.1 redoxin domain-containing protein [Kibdelosporangium philippinense]
MKALLVAVLLVLTGCAAEAPPAAKTPAQPKFQFTAKTLDDKDFDGATLAGKPAVIWFWTPWCPRCQGEAPHMGALAKQYEGKITFLGVGAQDQVPAMKKFVAENEVSGFTHLADVNGTVWTRFGITQQPAYAFAYADGTIELVKQQLSEIGLNERVAKLTAP